MKYLFVMPDENEIEKSEEIKYLNEYDSVMLEGEMYIVSSKMIDYDENEFLVFLHLEEDLIQEP